VARGGYVADCIAPERPQFCVVACVAELQVYFQCL